MASSQASPEVLNLVALIKTLTNPQLKDLLRNEGLAVSGVKASLQMRIIDCSSSLLCVPSLASPHFTLRFPPSILSFACSSLLAVSEYPLLRKRDLSLTLLLN